MESNATDLPSAIRLISLDTVSSTNDEVRRLAGDGAAEGTLVRARRQTAGRGRLGRTWISDPGNLYFSMLLRPECPLARAGQIGFVVANAVADAVAEVLPRSALVGCKWPNDVLVDGHKVSGMLLESEIGSDGRLAWLVAGIGVNIVSYPQDVRFPASSLRACGADATLLPDDVLAAFCPRFLDGYGIWTRDGFGPIRRAWLNHAVGRGEPIQVHAATTEEGVFEDMDGNGALIVRKADGSHIVLSAGDVYFPERPTGKEE